MGTGGSKLREDAIYLGGAPGIPDQYLALRLANRHGLVTGATGTGKTVSLQVLAEGFSEAGVPVFAADIKGDLSGLAARGEAKSFLADRAALLGFEDYDAGLTAFPVTFWDLFGEQGHPVRATITEMGPLLLSRLMGLNDTQEGVLNIVFRFADENGLLLLDLKDLRETMALIGADKELQRTLKARYGNVSPQSVGAIQRQLLVLEQQGALQFFGEPALELTDLMRTARDGRGMVNILAADRLMQAPRLYATFLLWLLSELFEQLPEVGDTDKPKLVFFFDEAHLLFDDAPAALVEKVEQVVRLVRSKGVGVYFVTQNPMDVPDRVSAQLGNRVQHALRAFTPRERKAVRAAAETFRDNPDLDTATVIAELGTGEALVSTLEAKGTPSMVQRTLIRPPSARIGPVTPAERDAVRAGSAIGAKYDANEDRESAYEILQRRAAAAARAEAPAPSPADPQGQGGWSEWLGGLFGGGGEERGPRGGRVRRPQSLGEAVVKSAARSASTAIGRRVGTALARNVLGTLLSGRR